MSKISWWEARQVRKVVRELRTLAFIAEHTLAPYRSLSEKWTAAELDALSRALPGGEGEGEYHAPSEQDRNQVEEALAATDKFIEHMGILADHAERRLQAALEAGKR
jgi:hypothetical protein